MDDPKARAGREWTLCLFPQGDVPRPGWLTEDVERAFRVYVELKLDRPRCSLHRHPA